MKVLLLFPMADKQTGPAIKSAFENLGHRVKAVDAKLKPGNSYQRAVRFRPDLVFCSRSAPLNIEVRKIKEKLNPVICVWNVDARASINHWKGLYPLIESCDYHFAVNERNVSQWGKRFKAKSIWLSQGLQDEVYDKPKRITNADRAKYACDVNWAGGRSVGCHKFRNLFLDTAERMNIKYKQWGCRGKPKIYNEEHNKMVSLSKINLGCSAFPENRKYVSVRDYKIFGAGGFLLEYYREGLYDIFPPSIIDSYRNINEFRRKIRYWLHHEERRKKVAERGYRWVRENATYTHRIKKALGYMGLGDTTGQLK